MLEIAMIRLFSLFLFIEMMRMGARRMSNAEVRGDITVLRCGRALPAQLDTTLNEIHHNVQASTSWLGLCLDVAEMANKQPRLTRFTNARLAVGNELQARDLWVDSSTGKIADAQTAFYDDGHAAVRIVDLGGKILAPGFIECQLNGGYGFDFSVPSPKYTEEFARVNRKLVETGVTSYLPTLTSQRPDVYRKVFRCWHRPSTVTRLWERSHWALIARDHFCQRRNQASMLQLSCSNVRRW